MEIISHADAGINSDLDKFDDILALPDNYTPPARPNRAARRHAMTVFRRVNGGTGGARRRVAPTARARRDYRTLRAALLGCSSTRYLIASPRHYSHPRQRASRAIHGASGKSGDDGDGGDGEPPHHPLVLDYYDLARLLRVAVGTLKNRYSQAPDTLPPAICIPGCRGPRWLLASVLRWLEAQEAKTQAPAAPVTPKRRVGRPRIALRGKGGAQ